MYKYAECIHELRLASELHNKPTSFPGQVSYEVLNRSNHVILDNDF